MSTPAPLVRRHVDPRRLRVHPVAAEAEAGAHAIELRFERDGFVSAAPHSADPHALARALCSLAAVIVENSSVAGTLAGVEQA